MISYEWVYEEIDEHGDIVDCEFGDTLKQVLMYVDAVKYDIGLVRNEGNNEEGLKHREYAYIKNNKLPIEFDDGYKIPKRFHNEVSKQKV